MSSGGIRSEIFKSISELQFFKNYNTYLEFGLIGDSNELFHLTSNIDFLDMSKYV